jgi:crotonobetainyl-CoA:carnitine CoA-transferase CaiB-like acyl-CoA transferase
MRPLDGVRVLDVSRVVSGPTCCFWLASMGAEVWRIEPPGGDITWVNPPFVGADDVHGAPRLERDIPISPLRKNRGKRSLVLDFASDAGRSVFLDLVGHADVLVENFKPGSMDRWGLGSDTLRALNPRLVYASITGYGHDGPYRDRPAMDIVVQAVSGLMNKTGFPGGPPVKTGATIADQVPGVFAALGILAALRQRDHTGVGQMVDVAMLDVMLALLWDEPIDHYDASGVPDRFGNADPRGVPFDVYPSADGWVAIAGSSDIQWKRLAEAMGRPELFDRWPDFLGRLGQREAIDAEVIAWTRSLPTDAIVTLLEAARVPVGPVNRAMFAVDDPYVAHRGALERLRHPDRSEPTSYLAPTLPIRFSDAPIDTPPAEPLGASTDAVLRDVLGLSSDDVARLRDAGAFG